MTLGPLGQTPFLDHLFVRLQLRELADDVAVEDGEFPTNVAAFELTRGSASEGCNTLRVCESAVQFFRGGAELVRCGHGGRVNSNFLVGGCGGGGGSRRRFLLGLRVVGGSSKAAGWVDTRAVLKVFAMFIDQGRA